VQSHVVIPADPHPMAEAGSWRYRRQSRHRPQIRREPVDGSALDRADRAGIGLRQPSSELLVEILRGGELPSWQEGSFQELVVAFCLAFEFRIPWWGQDDSGCER